MLIAGVHAQARRVEAPAAGRDAPARARVDVREARPRDGLDARRIAQRRAAQLQVVERGIDGDDRDAMVAQFRPRGARVLFPAARRPRRSAAAATMPPGPRAVHPSTACRCRACDRSPSRRRAANARSASMRARRRGRGRRPRAGARRSSGSWYRRCSDGAMTASLPPITCSSPRPSSAASGSPPGCCWPGRPRTLQRPSSARSIASTRLRSRSSVNERPGNRPAYMRNEDLGFADRHRLGAVAHAQALHAQQRTTPRPLGIDLVERHRAPGARAQPGGDAVGMAFGQAAAAGWSRPPPAPSPPARRRRSTTLLDARCADGGAARSSSAARWLAIGGKRAFKTSNNRSSSQRKLGSILISSLPGAGAESKMDPSLRWDDERNRRIRGRSCRFTAARHRTAPADTARRPGSGSTCRGIPPARPPPPTPRR